MKKVLFVYNCMSGQRIIPAKLDAVVQHFQNHGFMVLPFRVDGQLPQESIAHIAKHERIHCVAVSGGDGTVSGVVDIMLKNDLDIPFGIIPSGTSNDMARNLDIPFYIPKCIDIIAQGKTTEVDVGLINEKTHFLNTCAGGIFVDVSFNTSNELKKNIGPLAYYIKALTEVKNIKPVNLKVKTDNQIFEDQFFLFVIVNGRHAGGFNNILDKADIADGLMDMILLKNCSYIDLPALFFKVLANDFINDKHVLWLRTKQCTIECDEEIPLSVDGEQGEGLPVHVRFLNKRIKMFVP